MRRQCLTGRCGVWESSWHFGKHHVPRSSSLTRSNDSLHPFAHSVLLDAIDSASKGFPIVVSTHNPEILSHPTAIGDRIRIVQWNEGTSHIYPLSGEILAKLRPPMTVGRLLRSNAIWTEDEPVTAGAEADSFVIS